MILIKNGRVVDAKSNTDEILDVVLEGGKIKTIGKVEDDGSYEQVIDADGCVVAPGHAGDSREGDEERDHRKFRRVFLRLKRER